MENNQVKLIPREIREADFPIARFLSDKEQAVYKESIKQFSGKAYDSLNIPQKGSNLWKVLFLNQIGIRTAALPELELALENGMPLKGHYEDAPTVVLRSRGDNYERNNPLAKTLADKLKLTSFENPFIVKGLGIIQSDDKENPYELEFLTDNAEVIEAPDFHYKNNGRTFSTIHPDYTIEWDDSSNRTFYSRGDGVSRLHLYWNLNLYSDLDQLTNSNDNGRVVVVSPRGARKNFDEYLSKIEQERTKQIAEVDARFSGAMNYLKTGKL